VLNSKCRLKGWVERPGPFHTMVPIAKFPEGTCPGDGRVRSQRRLEFFPPFIITKGHRSPRHACRHRSLRLQARHPAYGFAARFIHSKFAVVLLCKQNIVILLRHTM